jgi:ParB/RepB/Spo0J family partition protein
MSTGNRAMSPESLRVFQAGSNVDAYLATLDSRGEESQRVQHVPLEALLAAAWQPRLREEPSTIEDLAASIRKNGLLHPITVRPYRAREGDPSGVCRYEIVAGHRRLAALKQLAEARSEGDSEILAPVMVRDLDDLEARILTYTENADRAGLSAYETARSIANVRDALNAAKRSCDVRAVARQVRRADGPTSEYLKIADEISEQALIAAGADRDGSIDFAIIARLSKDSLLKAAKEPEAATRLHAMRGSIAKIRASVVVPVNDPSAVNAVPAASRPRRSTPAITDEARTPRFSSAELKERGGFNMKLTKPLGSYTPDEARRHLRTLMSAVQALSGAVSEESVHFEQSSDGFVLYVRTHSGTPHSFENGKVLQRALVAIRQALGLRDGEVP